MGTWPSKGFAYRSLFWTLLSQLNVCVLSRVWLFVTPWTPLSMEFSRQEFWSGLPFHSPRYPPDPGTEPMFLVSFALQEDSSALCFLGSPQLNMPYYINVSSWQATLHIRITGACMQCSGWRMKGVLSSATQGYQETKNKCLDGPPEFRMQSQTVWWFSAMQV